MTAQATIITNSKDEAHLIPVAAVRFKPPKRVVSYKKIFKEYSENLPEPVRVLQNLNVKISSGEFVCLMGPSGSGKSTLLNLLGLLDSPTSGTIFFDAREISQLTSLEKANLRN